jgi:hypothetical protein
MFFVLSVKFLILNFVLKFFHSPKKILIFIKYFLEKKSSLSHHITKEKKTKKKHTHPLPPHTLPHITKRIIPWKIKKSHLHASKKKTKPLLLMPPKKQPFGLVPIPKKFSYPNPLKETPFERGGITSSSPLHPKKPLLKKRKKF